MLPIGILMSTSQGRRIEQYSPFHFVYSCGIFCLTDLDSFRVLTLAKLNRKTKRETHRILLRQEILPRAIVSSVGCGCIKCVCIWIQMVSLPFNLFQLSHCIIKSQLFLVHKIMCVLDICCLFMPSFSRSFCVSYIYIPTPL